MGLRATPFELHGASAPIPAVLYEDADDVGSAVVLAGFLPRTVVEPRAALR